MHAIVKSLHSPDIDLKSFSPSNPSDFGFLLQAMIGPSDDETSESFDFQICTPQWIIRRHQEKLLPNAIFGMHMIIVFEYDVNLLKNHIERYCSKYVENDWESLANKLSKIGRWEFEDYH